MSYYDTSVNVSFDPCALRQHDWRKSSFGLASLTGVETCFRCGAINVTSSFEASGISRAKITVNGDANHNNSNL